MSTHPHHRTRALLIAALTFVTSAVSLVPTLPATAHPGHEHLTDITIPAGDFQQVSLAAGNNELGEPMSLAVLPDRSVLHTSRDGTVRLTDASGNTTTAGKLNVYTHDEEGLQGVAADPGFATNRYVWLYYSPRLDTPGGDAPASGSDADWQTWKGHLNLSRFTLKADKTLDMSSEKVVLTVDNDRGQCCHVGGDIDFDADGNLYLTTGDDTNPFESGSFTPIDERTDRNPQYDAQRSSGNTNDLRGKLLRIRPEPDGTYSVPEGNLFPPGTPKTRPEIYAMGLRNPFRMSVDKATGIVYLGDYGPDAGGSDPNRGPAGQVEFNRVTKPGNFGWPYCTGTNTAAETYTEFTFPNGPAGAKYDCANGPQNNSFRNTGLATLPPAQASWIRYGGDAGSPPEFGGGSESPMGGPVYNYDAALDSSIKFPEYLDGRYFAGELGRRWIKVVGVEDDGTAGQIDDFPWTGTQVMDMAFGPDGALYVLDYGTYANDQALYRIEYLGGANRSPIAKASADKTSGPAPLTVAFSSEGSSDPEESDLTYSWDFGDGATSDQAKPSHTYTRAGTFTATLTVTDEAGATATANVSITSGNTAPAVKFVNPGDGQLIAFGDTVPFEVTVSDDEDTAIDCATVKVTYLLGHDSHQHQITSQTGCRGSIAIPNDGEHDAAANIFGVLTAEYTDKGGLTSKTSNVLQPRHRQAEHFSTSEGIKVTGHAGAEGGSTVGFIESGDWIAFNRYRLDAASKLTVRASSAGAGGTVEVRAGSATGPLLGSGTVPVTGGWDTYKDVTIPLAAGPAETTTLYLVFRSATAQGYLFDIDSFTFGAAATTVTVEGEAYTSHSGVQPAAKSEASGGFTAGYLNNGDWAGYGSVDTAGATSITARISSAGAGGVLEIRAGSATGTLLGSIQVPVTGDWARFRDVATTLKAGPGGPLFLSFTGGAGYLFDIDTLTLTKGGTAAENNVLVFSRTAGFRHDSIPVAVQTIKDLAGSGGYSVTATEDAAVFTAENLARYKAVVFVSTTGDVLDDAQQSAFQAYINGGGGYVGIHAASDAEYSWPYYGTLVGAWFKNHPAIQQATVTTEDRAHPATKHLDGTSVRTDEWYNFRANPRADVHVLQSIDESSYTGGEMGGDHPITWCHTVDKGRSFYTGLGHANEAYADEDFRGLLVGGIRWAAGAEAGNCAKP